MFPGAAEFAARGFILQLFCILVRAIDLHIIELLVFSSNWEESRRSLSRNRPSRRDSCFAIYMSRRTCTSRMGLRRRISLATRLYLRLSVFLHALFRSSFKIVFVVVVVVVGYDFLCGFVSATFNAI